MSRNCNSSNIRFSPTTAIIPQSPILGSLLYSPLHVIPYQEANTLKGLLRKHGSSRVISSSPPLLYIRASLCNRMALIQNVFGKPVWKILFSRLAKQHPKRPHCSLWMVGSFAVCVCVYCNTSHFCITLKGLKPSVLWI